MIVRFVFFFVGLVILSLGIVVVTRSDLGTSTVSSLALVMAPATGISMGVWVIITNMFFFVVNIFVEPKGLIKRGLGQFLICCCFGFLIDAFLWLTPWIAPEAWLTRFGVVLIGTLLIALGVSSMVYARLLLFPPEGLVISILKRWGGSFGTLRMGVDVFLVITTVLLSWAIYGEIRGIREGTLVTMIGVGRVAHIFLHWLGQLFPKYRVID